MHCQELGFLSAGLASCRDKTVSLTCSAASAKNLTQLLNTSSQLMLLISLAARLSNIVYLSILRICRLILPIRTVARERTYLLPRRCFFIDTNYTRVLVHAGELVRKQDDLVRLAPAARRQEILFLARSAIAHKNNLVNTGAHGRKQDFSCSCPSSGTIS